MPRPARPKPYHKTLTDWLTPEGKRCKRHEPGAVKRNRKTATFYADIPGVGTVSLETDDEHQAWITLRDKLKQAREMKLGIIDEQTEHAKTEIDAHIDQWAAMLTAKGTSPEQVNLASSRMKRLAKLASWKRLPQITHDSALAALAKVQAPEADGGLDKSAASRNHYLGHLKAFAAWAADGGRMKGNLVRRIKPIRTESDRRHARRAPEAEEIAELCRWLASDAAGERRGLSPIERRLGYLVSMATGFRAGELRALQLDSFDLKGGLATVPAGYSKRRRNDTQRLPPWLVEELRAHLNEGGAWHWGELPREGPGKLLRADLDAARAAWIAAAEKDAERERRQSSNFLRYEAVTPAGSLFFDYHSLRHSYNSFMANMPGMDLKTLLTLTRLSSAELALKTYAHPEQQRIDAAVKQIPSPQKRKP